MRKNLIFLILTSFLFFLSACEDSDMPQKETIKKLIIAEEATHMPSFTVEECEGLDDVEYSYGTYDEKKNITARTNCLNGVALLQSVRVNPSTGLRICNGITDNFGKDLCYFIVNNNEDSEKEIVNGFIEEQARESGNPAVCDGMDAKRGEIELCKSKVQIKGGNVVGCGNDETWEQFYCVYSIAQNKNKMALCEYVRLKEKIGDCYNHFAFKAYKETDYQKSAEICENIRYNEKQKKSCLDRALARTKYWQEQRRYPLITNRE